MQMLRKVRLEASKDRPFILELWDTLQREGGAFGRCFLGYRLTGPEGVVFEGEDYSPGASTAIDSDESLRGLLGFLTLRPGDTDTGHFENYTPEQIFFTEQDAEYLSIYADEENPEPFEGMDVEE